MPLFDFVFFPSVLHGYYYTGSDSGPNTNSDHLTLTDLHTILSRPAHLPDSPSAAHSAATSDSLSSRIDSLFQL